MAKSKKNKDQNLQDPAELEQTETQPEAEQEQTATAPLQEPPSSKPSKKEKSNELPKGVFEYKGKKYKLKVPRFSLDNREYSIERVMAKPELQEELVRAVFYDGDKELDETTVRSSVLTIVY